MSKMTRRDFNEKLVPNCISPRTYMTLRLPASVQANIRLRAVVLREPQHDGYLCLGVFDFVVGLRLSKADAQTLTIAF